MPIRSINFKPEILTKLDEQRKNVKRSEAINLALEYLMQDPNTLPGILRTS